MAGGQGLAKDVSAGLVIVIGRVRDDGLVCWGNARGTTEASQHAWDGV
jgi:hypothetical protein